MKRTAPPAPAPVIYEKKKTTKGKTIKGKTKKMLAEEAKKRFNNITKGRINKRSKRGSK